LLLPLVAPTPAAAGAAAPRPNVLFIAIDDLNDWVGCLGGHPQAHTPNIDRLARRGVLFTNAHCQAPICQPSRSSLLSGTYPFHNGVYDIPQRMRDAPALKDAVTLPQYLAGFGYKTISAGKVFHRPEETAWHENGPAGRTFPKFPWFGKTSVSGLPLVGPGGRVFDFGPVDAKPEELPDGKTATWAVARIRQGLPEPFFFAVGFTGTHLPLFASRETHRRFPPAAVRLPVAPMDDLEDVPPMGRKFTRYFDFSPLTHNEILRRGLWHRAVAAYLACVTEVDLAVGRVLDALEKSPHSQNTLIVLWSDHGFHLGEKLHWEKRSLWDRSTRGPLIFSGPASSIPIATCSRTIGLIDLYPTLVELCGLPAKPGLDGRSLAPLLRDPQRAWPYPALTTQMPGNHAVRTEQWRYIRYVNGDEELYDMRADPHELTNLAGDPRRAATKSDLARWLPKQETPMGPRLPTGATEFEFDWTKP
jgi:arylsulfatase A-like enzyme